MPEQRIIIYGYFYRSYNIIKGYFNNAYFFEKPAS